MIFGSFALLSRWAESKQSLQDMRVSFLSLYRGSLGKAYWKYSKWGFGVMRR